MVAEGLIFFRDISPPDYPLPVCLRKILCLTILKRQVTASTRDTCRQVQKQDKQNWNV